MYQTFWWKALVGMAKGVWRVATFAPGAGGGGVLGLMFAGYVPLASQSPYPIIVYIDPILVTFWKMYFFAIPTLSLSIYASTLSMWFQAAECKVVNASLLLNLINNNFLIF